MNSILEEDLERWGRTLEEQGYPHRPEAFLKPFPETAKQDQLVNTVWWWRQAVSADNCSSVFPRLGEDAGWWPEIMRQIFLEHFQPSAFFYEFRARYDNRHVWDFGRPWICCSDEQRRSLNCLLPSKYPSKLNLHLDRPEDKWASFGKFNLLLNDKTLVRQFVEELTQKRSELRLKKPGYGKGVRRRAISWVPIESMDIRRYRIRALTDAERSALSKAEKSYEKTCAKLGFEP